MNPSRRRLLAAPLLGAALPLRAEAALWAARFKTPAGAELALADFKGQWLLVNFWATWCAPCIKELPDLDRFHADFAAKGWRVLGLAIDGPTPVREFLAKRPVRFPVGLAGLNGAELARTLGNLRGGLPFTVLANPAGELIWRHPGETKYAQLAALRAKLLAG